MDPEEAPADGAVEQRVGGQLADDQGRVTGHSRVPPLEDHPGGPMPAERDGTSGGRVVDPVLTEDGLGGGC